MMNNNVFKTFNSTLRREIGRSFTSSTRKFFVGGNWKSNGSRNNVFETFNSTLRREIGRRFMSSTRKFFVAGNWKSDASGSDFINILNEGTLCNDVEVVMCAPSSHAINVDSIRSDIALSSQDVSLDSSGDLSAAMLLASGLQWCLTGHHERRISHGETNEVVGTKTRLGLEGGLKVIACVGETLEQRMAIGEEVGEGSTKFLDIVFDQLGAVASELTPACWDKTVIAYEPVWAIGTGVPVQLPQAQEMVGHIRGWIKDNVSSEVADSVRIIYGGPINAANCVELSEVEGVDGFLVSDASLTTEFLEIARAGSSAEA